MTIEFYRQNLRVKGQDAEETWLLLMLRTEDQKWRDELAAILNRRQLLDTDLIETLEWVRFVERFMAENQCPTLVHHPPLTLQVVGQWSRPQRRLFLAELFLTSRNVHLLDLIGAEDVWQVMLDMQILSSLKKWIDNQSHQNSTPQQTEQDIPYVWPISQQMMDAAYDIDNADTRNSVLNLLAGQGMFASRERSDLLLLVRRLHNINQLDQLDRLVQLPSANIRISEIHQAVVEHCCLGDNYRPELFQRFIRDHHAVDLSGRPLWIRWLAAYEDWIKDSRDLHKFIDVFRLNVALLNEGSPSEEHLPTAHPFVVLFLHFLGESDATEEQMVQAFSSIPFYKNLFVAPPGEEQQQTTVYHLLDGEIAVDVARFFSWRTDTNGMPHFGRSDLCRQHGQSLKLSWIYHLQQNRPFHAYFVMQKQLANGENNNKDNAALYPFVLASIALDDPFNLPQSQSAVLLLEMLGADSAPLRTTLCVLDRVLADDAHESQQKQLMSVSRDLMQDAKSARWLQQRLVSSLLNNKQELQHPVDLINSWQPLIQFSSSHGLELPAEFLDRAAERNRFLDFLFFADFFNYPPQLCMKSARHFDANLQKHMELVLSVDAEDQRIPLAEDFYQIVYRAANDDQVKDELLEMAMRTENDQLAVLAACFDRRKLFHSLCLYIYLNVKDKPLLIDGAAATIDPYRFSAESLSLLLTSALSSRQFSLVLKSFRIFIFDHPLTVLLNWLESFCLGRSDETLLHRVRDCVSAADYQDDFFACGHQLLRICLLILTGTLCHVVVDAGRQLELVSHLSNSRLFDSDGDGDSDSGTEKLPDFSLIASLLHLAIGCDVALDLQHLLRAEDTLPFRDECQRAVELLLERRHFESALKFASLANLPADAIFVTQLAAQFESERPEGLRPRLFFWTKCDHLLTIHRVQPSVASTFFQDCLNKSDSHSESLHIVGHAIDWIKRVDPLPVKDLARLHIKWWTFRIESCIQQQQQQQQQQQLESTSYLSNNSNNNVPLLKDKLLQAAAVDHYPAPDVTIYSPEFVGKVNEFIGDHLDRGDLVEAMQLSAMFSQPSADLDVILFVLDLVQDMQQVPFQVPALVDLEAHKLKDRQSVIERVGNRIRHGRDVVRRVETYWKVCAALDFNYPYLVDHPKPICILKM